MAFIYTLSDPRLFGMDAIRYVGVTHGALSKRLSVHLADARRATSDHRTKWIGSLLRDGVRPVIAAIETVEGDAWQREREVIAAYRAAGYRLVNGTDGGGGALGRRQSEAVKAKLRQLKTGVPLSGSHRRHISEAQQGRMPPAHVVAASVARFRSPEHKAKVAAAMRSPERRAAVSQATRGRKKPDGFGAKVSAALAGRTMSEQQRVQMVANRRSPEQRARSAEAKRAWWAARKAAAMKDGVAHVA